MTSPARASSAVALAYPLMGGFYCSFYCAARKRTPRSDTDGYPRCALPQVRATTRHSKVHIGMQLVGLINQRVLRLKPRGHTTAARAHRVSSFRTYTNVYRYRHEE
jgi:hypothetical protein